MSCAAHRGEPEEKALAPTALSPKTLDASKGNLGCRHASSSPFPHNNLRVRQAKVRATEVRGTEGHCPHPSTRPTRAQSSVSG